MTSTPAPAVPDGDVSSAHLSAGTYAIVRAVIRATAGRAHLTESDREDFEAFVWTRLIARNCHVLRCFGHRSSMRTYLTVVVRRMLLDYRDAQWGRWRPSAAARRRGAAAVAFERLVNRDGLATNIAAARLGIEMGDMPAAGPIGRRRIEQSLDTLADMPAAPETSADRSVLSEERRVALASVRSALACVLAALTDEDRDLLWLRHAAGLTVASIARRRGIDAKKLYRRYERLHSSMRLRLQEFGVSSEFLVDLIGASDACVGELLRPPRGPSRMRSTTQPSASSSTRSEHGAHTARFSSAVTSQRPVRPALDGQESSAGM